MSNRVTCDPTYHLKKSGSRRYAVVSLRDGSVGRHDVLLGRFGTKESRQEYVRAGPPAIGLNCRRAPVDRRAGGHIVLFPVRTFYPHFQMRRGFRPWDLATH